VYLKFSRTYLNKAKTKDLNTTAKKDLEKCP